ncbi:MAG: caspase family protein [Bacteroidales bacterium]|nr:caspase family protein [Bacteroidales bacterium]
MKFLFFISALAAAFIPFQISSQVQNQASYQQQKRIALVIGNGNYLTGPLANPENDARAMKASLQDVGFTVLEYENLTQGQMKRAIDEFGESMKDYDVGLFYYAGHGIQSKGYNYLVPVDAQLTFEKQIEYDCVQADRIIALMQESGAQVNVIILDACRNNPFERSWTRSATGQGLAFMNAPRGTLIAYATSPGNTASDGSGKNGLYTSAILESIVIPDLTIIQMFQNVRNIVVKKSNNQQIPWESTSLTGDFYFNRSEPPVEKVPVIGDIKEASTYGSIELNTEIAGELYLDDKKISDVTSNTIIQINRVKTGDHILKITGAENWTEPVTVIKDQKCQIIAKSSHPVTVFRSTQSGEFADYRDGRKYKWIKIGNQVWMAENLAYLPDVSPASAGSGSVPHYYVYDYKGRNVSDAKTMHNDTTYGVLYNWPAAMNGAVSSDPIGVNGICPIGWHLPSDAEWTLLVEYLGGEHIAGGKLKEAGSGYWHPNTDADNISGFTALPGGCRFDDKFFTGIGSYGYWWSATEKNSSNAWIRYMSGGSTNIKRFPHLKSNGFSIRCVRDN